MTGHDFDRPLGERRVAHERAGALAQDRQIAKHGRIRAHGLGPPWRGAPIDARAVIASALAAKRLHGVTRAGAGEARFRREPANHAIKRIHRT